MSNLPPQPEDTIIPWDSPGPGKFIFIEFDKTPFTNSIDMLSKLLCVPKEFILEDPPSNWSSAYVAEKAYLDSLKTKEIKL